MNEDKEDLRVIRTRKLLCTSLINLMQTTPFDELTVNDICQNAMVHRATFYNHFNDKNDLLNYTLDELQEELFEKSIEKEIFSSQKEMFMALVECVIDFISENKQQFVLIFKNSPEKMTTLVSSTINRSIRYLISKNKYKQQYLLPIDIIVNFFTGGISMIGIDWIESKKPYTKSEMMEFFDILLNEDAFVKRN